MFRLEKIFQQDDHFYINISIFLKSFLVFLLIYIFSILEFNSIFDLLNYNIYKTSKYFILFLYKFICNGINPDLCDNILSRIILSFILISSYLSFHSFSFLSSFLSFLSFLIIILFHFICTISFLL